jgi:periplasmic protein TonB
MWIGYTAYAVLALVGFCFGAWAGNQRPKVVEVVKAAPAPAPVEPKPAEKKKTEKKEGAVAMPDPMPMPMPEPEPMKKTEPEPKPESKPEPKPEPKKPEPKPSPEPKKDVTAVSFEKEILPIFKAKCNLCHGDTKGIKGDLDLRTLAAIKKGGDNGDALVPGDLTKSLIWSSIVDEVMPPPDKPQLTEAEKTKIMNWILSGGK